MPFWTQTTIVCDPEYEKKAFNLYLEDHDFEGIRLPPRRHVQKRDEIEAQDYPRPFGRLKTSKIHDAWTEMSTVNCERPIRIWNDLYGNGIMLAKN